MKLLTADGGARSQFALLPVATEFSGGGVSWSPTPGGTHQLRCVRMQVVTVGIPDFCHQNAKGS